MPVLSLRALNSALSSAKARWVACQTPQSLLSDREKMALLGVVMDEKAHATAMSLTTRATPVPAFAPAVDWRNHNGNHVTPIKDQGIGCGSCVSFACCALTESMASIEHGLWLDLSEADSHFCSSHGASCRGWDPTSALGQIQSRGVIPETAFPYMNAFDNPPIFDKDGNWIAHCANTPNRDATAVKISSFGVMNNVIDYKNYLTNNGPCVATMQVYNDFFNYGITSNIYHHLMGSYYGDHAVLVIGYSDTEGCWICKNSWHTTWGNAGYFKIAYGECQIEQSFWTAKGVVVPSYVSGTGPAIAYYTAGNNKQLETLFVSPTGQLGLTWKVNNSSWIGAVFLSGSNFLPQNAHISVVNYPLNNQLEAFYAANDGAIYVSYKANNGPWSQPIRLTALNTMRPGGSLSAVYYPLNNQLEVLYIGSDGALNVLWKAQNGTWFSPARISAPNTAPSGGGISAAFYPLNNQLEALYAGNDGAIRVSWKANNGTWYPPAVITPANLTPAGAEIALQYYPLNNQLEAFFIDNSGTINVLWKAQNSTWYNPVGISPARTGVPGKSIVAAFYPLNNQLEVFTIGTNGAVNLLWKAQNSIWKPLVNLTAGGVAQPGSPLGVQFQPLNNQLEVFYTDTSGSLGLVCKVQNQNWNPAFRFYATVS